MKEGGGGGQRRTGTHKALDPMLESLRTTTRGYKQTKRRATAKIFFSFRHW